MPWKGGTVRWFGGGGGLTNDGFSYSQYIALKTQRNEKYNWTNSQGDRRNGFQSSSAELV